MGKNYNDMRLRDRIIRDVGISRIPCDNIPPSAESRQRLWNRIEEYEETQKRRKNTKKILSRTTISLAAVIILFSVTVFSVPALRVRLLGFSYTPSLSGNEYIINQNGGTITIQVTGFYLPAYIPDGYVYESLSDGQLQKSIRFQKDGGMLEFSQQMIETTGMKDIETAEVKQVPINDGLGTFTYKEEQIELMWGVEDYLFTITADKTETLTEKELITMAESVSLPLKTEGDSR